MQSHHLAVYTFNQFIAPYQSDAIKGFRDAEPGAFAEMERASGFIARSGYEGEEGPLSWGPQVFPKCWENSNGDGWAPSTLSLWETIEALMAATYHGHHGDAYRQGSKWHLARPGVPEYVLWWIPAGRQPDWTEAVSRFEDLMDNGPNVRAFSFKKAFSPDGQTVKPDAARAKAIARETQAIADIA
ncbi:MAG: DUF3291 domain-containing protein [Labrenzia sp.]